MSQSEPQSIREGTFPPPAPQPAPTTTNTAGELSFRLSWVVFRRLLIWTATWISALFLLLSLLTGCVNRDVEMPSNSGEGSDLMLKSPCACQQLDYDSRGYTWAS